MTYSLDVTVTEIRVDSDPAGNIYSQVCFGYRIPLPSPPMPMTDQGVPMPKPTAFKHALHLMIPKDKWINQFQQWENYHLIVTDDGSITLKKVTQ